MTQTYGDGSLPFLAALGEHAKQHPKRRYRNLYKTMCRMDVLQRAWAQAAANDGAAGIDGIGFVSIEKGPGGVDGFLEKLQSDLLSGAYQPQPVRRVNIPKEGKPGQSRPLGIPTIRGRVAMTAAKLVLEPIMEARFLNCFPEKQRTARATWIGVRTPACRQYNIARSDGRVVKESI